MHRPYSGEVKGVLITRSGDEWYVIIQADQEVAAPRREGRSVGIDVGLNSFAVDSDGRVIANPRFSERSRARLKKLQQRVARKQRGSKNRENARRKKLEKAYAHITNQKNDFLHKLSRRYVDAYATICVEDLNVKYLKENGNLADSAEVSMMHHGGRFLAFLSYKAESAGTEFIRVDPRDTTQMCSNCGRIVKKDLSVRVHECPYCGFVGGSRL